MRNIWLVAVREFRERVRNRGFLIASIAIPILLIIVWTATGVFELGIGAPDEAVGPPEPSSDGLIGIVDQAGFIESIPDPLPEEIFRIYPDTAAANTALEIGEIEVYYRIPSDYLETGTVAWVSLDLPDGPPETGMINDILRSNLLPKPDAPEFGRIQDPFGAGGLQFEPLDENAEPAGDGFSFMPFLVTFIIIMPLFTSGSYLLQSLAQEKSTRVMEILLVSLKPRQLLAGKLIGLGALTLVQYLIWVIIFAISLVVTGQDASQMLAGINFTLDEALWVFLFALGGYFLYAAFMAGLGAMAPNLEGGRSWVLLISLPMMIPIYLWAAIVQAPNSVLAVILSLIPLTAPVAMLMRMTSAAVPLWQTGLSLALLVLAALITIWLMARLFRVQTLLSGEAISLRRIWTALRG